MARRATCRRRTIGPHWLKTKMALSLETILRTGETLDDLRRAFMENVAVDPCGCWYWRGKRDAYGNFRGKPAHCVSWELHQGPIPEGLYILHGCDVAGANDRAEYGCVNPAHLRPGTPKQNSEDVQRARERARRRMASAGAVDVLAALENCDHRETKSRVVWRKRTTQLYLLCYVIHRQEQCINCAETFGEEPPEDAVSRLCACLDAIGIDQNESWLETFNECTGRHLARDFVRLLAVPVHELSEQIQVDRTRFAGWLVRDGSFPEYRKALSRLATMVSDHADLLPPLQHGLFVPEATYKARPDRPYWIARLDRHLITPEPSGDTWERPPVEEASDEGPAASTNSPSL